MSTETAIREFELRIGHDNFILRDHVIYGVRVLPGVTYLDLVCRLARAHLGLDRVTLGDVLFHSPLVTEQSMDRQVRVRFMEVDEGWTVDVSSRAARTSGVDVEPASAESDVWIQHATCSLTPLQTEVPACIDVDDTRSMLRSGADMEVFYQLAREVHIAHGPFMKPHGVGIQASGTAAAELRLTEIAARYADRFLLHPAFLDAATFLGAAANLDSFVAKAADPYIPFTIRSFHTFGDTSETCFILAEVEPVDRRSSEILAANVALYDTDGLPLARFERLCFKRIRSKDDILAVLRRALEPLQAASANGAPTDEIGGTPTDEIGGAPTDEIGGTPADDDGGASSNGTAYPSAANGRKPHEAREPAFRADPAPVAEVRPIRDRVAGDLRARVARLRGCRPSDVAVDRPFYDQGLDSKQLVALGKELEADLGERLHPTLLFEYNKIVELSGYMAEEHRDAYLSLLEAVSGRAIEPQTTPAPQATPAPEETPGPEGMPVPGDGPRRAPLRPAAPPTPFDTAVIGIAGRYPGSPDLDAFWRNVAEMRDCITEVPADRWAVASPGSSSGAPAGGRGGFIGDVHAFDPLFFALTPGDAERLDPQARQLLEVAWHAVEDAGYTRASLAERRVGVFIGAMNYDHTWVVAEEYRTNGGTARQGSYGHELANRVSNFMDFRGPSVTVESACSSSMTALHLARRALLNGDCDVALVGGVNLCLHPSKYEMLGRMHLLSTDGVERTFDEGATGYVPSEGVGVVVLKPLDEARVDRDHVYGVVKGTAVGHFGVGSGRYVPDLKGITETAIRALQEAGVAATDLDYIECHGTGSPLGDPIEVQALSKVFEAAGVPGEGSCVLGSKANFGHAEAAAGVCALTKVLLALQHRRMPGCPNVERVNPAIALEDTPFRISTDTGAWPGQERPRRAAINCFGVGGATSFAIVEEAPEASARPPRQSTQEPRPILLSARTEEQLLAVARGLSRLAVGARQDAAAPAFADFAYTLQSGREPLPWRFAFMADGWGDVEGRLVELLRGDRSASRVTAGVDVGSIPSEAVWSADAGDPTGVLRHWLRGGAVDWDRWWGEASPRRVSLPGYPFARVDCRGGGAAATTASGSRGNLLQGVAADSQELRTNADGGALRFFAPTWVEVPTRNGGAGSASEARWVVLEEEPLLAPALRTRVGTVVCLEPGSGVQRLAADHFRVRFDGRQDLTACLAEAGFGDRAPTGVVVRLGRRDDGRSAEGRWDDGRSEVGKLDKVAPRAWAERCSQVFRDGLALARTLMALHPRTDVHLLFVEEEGGRGAPSMLGSVGGFLRTLRLEYPRIVGRYVQLAWPEAVDWGSPEIHDAVVRECADESGEPDDVRFGPGGLRWIRRYTPCSGEDPRSSASPVFREGGCYVVTGGAGALGTVIARRLLQTGGARVALLGRSAPGTRHAEVVRRLEALGGEVRYLPCDVTRPGEVRAALDEIRRTWGAVNGVIHAAGVVRDGLVFEKEWVRAESVLAPKLVGTAVLDEATRDDDLDFFVLFSSLASVLGNAGQSDYAFANGFLDDFARWRRAMTAAGKRRGTSLSLNWPLWNDQGMATGTVIPADTGLLPMDAAHGARAMEWALAADPDAQVVPLVVRADGAGSVLAMNVFRAPTARPTTAGAPSSGEVDVPARRSAGSRSRGTTEGILVSELADLLRVRDEEIALDEELIVYGVDSVNFMEYAERLNRRLGSELTPSDLLDHPTLRALAEHLTGAESTPSGNVTSSTRLTVRQGGAGEGVCSQGASVSRTFEPNEPTVRDHQVMDRKILAGAVYVDLAVEATKRALGEQVCAVTDIVWTRPLIVEDDPVEAEVELTPRDGGYEYRVQDARSKAKVFSKGRIHTANLPSLAGDTSFLDGLDERYATRLEGRLLYNLLRGGGFGYGPMYRVITDLYVRPGEAVTRLEVAPEFREIAASHALFPGLLDGALHSVLAMEGVLDPSPMVMIPFGIDRIDILGPLTETCWVHVTRGSDPDEAPDRRSYDLDLMDADGRMAVRVKGLTGRKANPIASARGSLRTATDETNGDETNSDETSAMEGNVGDVDAREVERSTGDERPARSAPTDPTKDSRVAVVAVAGRFPQAGTLEEFWSHIIEKRDVITEIPPDRWDYRRSFAPEVGVPDKTYSKWGGFLREIDTFDAGFFKVRDFDALSMDPQQRIVLEVGQELFDRAGYGRKELRGRKVAVVIGAGASGYSALDASGDPVEARRNIVANSIPNMMAARLAHHYDLRGAALTLDTACSSSAVAIHDCCRRLLSGDCELAIAGGVTVLIDDTAHVGFSQARVMSDDGRCYVFDKRAKGMVLGEAVGLTLLKRYEDAVADGDQILAVVRGSAVNNDGATMGVTTPNMQMQRECITEALHTAGVSASEVTYLEVHGTGTLLGDPIEIKAATQAFRRDTDREQFCGVGSVKSNVGHTLYAAGICAFTKVVLALRHRTLPATLHCETPHPRFEFAASPFFPVTRTQPWEVDEGPRCAGMSSFGFGGTNCHLILEEFIPDERYVPKRRPLPVTEFHRKRYWFGRPIEPVESAPRTATSEFIGAGNGDGAARNGASEKGTAANGASGNGDGSASAAEVAGGNGSHAPAPRSTAATPMSAAEVEATIGAYLVGKIAGALDVPASEVDQDEHLLELGLDSASLIQMAEDLETDLGITLYPTVFFEYQTLREVIGYFAAEHAEAVQRLRDGHGGASSSGGSSTTRPAPATVVAAQPVHAVAGPTGPSTAAAPTARPADVDVTTAPSATAYPAAANGTSTVPPTPEARTLPTVGTPPSMEGAVRRATSTSVTAEAAGTIARGTTEAAATAAPGTAEATAAAAGNPSETAGANGSHAVGASPASATPMSAAEVEATIGTYLVGKIAGALDVPASEVDQDEHLLELGLDSASLIQMAEDLETDLGITLYPTVFFEYQTLREVIGYFATEHAEAVQRLRGGHGGASPSAGSAPATPSAATTATAPDVATARPTDMDAAVAPSATTHPAATNGTSTVPATPEAHAPSPEAPAPRSTATTPMSAAEVEATIGAYLVGKIAGALDVPASEVDQDEHLLELGLDSASLIQMAEDLETDLEITLYPTVFFEYQTLREVIGYFATEHAEAVQRLPNAHGGASASPSGGSATTGLAVTTAPASADVADRPPTATTTDDSVHYYTVDWVDTPSRVLAEEHLAALGTRPLVVASADPSVLSGYRTAFDQRPGWADVGHAFLELGDRPRLNDEALGVDVADQEGVEALMNRLSASIGWPERMLVVVTLDEGAPDWVSALEQEARTAVALLKHGVGGGRRLELTWAVRSSETSAKPVAVALESFAKSVAIELPGVSTRVVVVANDVSDPEAVALRECIHDEARAPIAIISGRGRKAWTLARVDGMPRSAAAGSWIGGDGTYLVTGGMGGLGWILAQALARETGARLILSGRRPASETFERRLDVLRSLGARAEYVACDVSDPLQVRDVVQHIRDAHGGLDGIIHSAGVLRDQTLSQKDLSDFMDVLAPKVRGVTALDEATRDEPLRFFVCFSSLAAVTGNRGQTDYACANGFLDGFAEWRNAMREAGRRHGRAVSINWPLWDEGGMRPHRMVIDYMRRVLGMDLLDSGNGVAALNAVMSADLDQVVVVKGGAGVFEPWMGVSGERPPRSAAGSPGLAQATPATVPPTVDRSTKRDDAIAVVGMAGRFPGAPDLESFWSKLEAEEDLVTSSKDRIDWQSFGARLTQGLRSSSFSGGFIDDIEAFDAEYFRISRAEAEVMDPQQRLIIQYAWAALEDAGYDPAKLAGSNTGVFVGASTSDYHELLILNLVPVHPQHSIGLAKTMIANRVSHLLDLHGPSEVVDTACSSSLVALHRAVAALRDGECEQAVVGGVNALVSPIAFVAFGKTGILSETARCRAFAKNATGYVRGEGVGCVVLKPLQRAIEEGDPIHAVIRGSRLNHGGRAQSLTAPTPKLQASVISDAIVTSGVDPSTITYVEAHGTGTALGDPVEVEGLKRGFASAARDMGVELADGDVCGVGSVKTNIGHLEAAAGIAGLIKVLLCLKHGRLPASLHLDEVNPYIDLKKSPFYLVRGTHDWPRLEGTDGVIPRRAGLSSFGFGGTNAHVIVEEYLPTAVQEKAVGSEPRPELIVLSAQSSDQVTTSARALVKWLENERARGASVRLSDVAFTLQVGRAAHAERLAVVADSAHDLFEKLSRFVDGVESADVWRATAGDGRALEAVFGGETGSALVAQLVAAGDLERVARIWLAGGAIDWTLLHRDRSPRRVSVPTYPFKKTPHWFLDGPGPLSRCHLAPEQLAEIQESRSRVREPVAADSPSDVATSANVDASPEAPPKAAESPAAVRDFLLGEIADILKVSRDAIDPDTPLIEYGLTSVSGMDLGTRVQAAYRIPLYVHEVVQQDTLAKLARYLHGEVSAARKDGGATSAATGDGVEQGAGSTGSGVGRTAPGVVTQGGAFQATDVAVSSADGSEPSAYTGDPVVFLLSAPRAGSTLLRAMLGGHSRLFAPPELHLLGFDTLSERGERLGGTGLDEGFIEALRHLHGVDAEDAIERVRTLERDGASVRDAYQVLLDGLDGRCLVDKSPSYGWQLETLRKAESLFAEPRYLFLVRHPAAVAESIVRNRFHRLVPVQGENGPSDAWGIAEGIWATIHGNVLAFLEEIPDSRCLTVFFEDLVTRPEEEMRRVSRFLGLDFEEAMLRPYEGDRMIRGLHDVSLTIGDPRFLTHTAIDRGLASAWAAQPGRLAPSATTVEAADVLGYDVGHAYPLTPDLSDFVRANHARVTWNLVHTFTVEGGEPWDADRLGSAVRTVMRLHPILGTLLDREDEAVLRRASEDAELADVDVCDLSGMDEEKRATDFTERVDALAGRIDPVVGPTVGVVAARWDETRRRVALVLPHLHADGLASFRVLRSVLEIYEGRTAALPGRHEDYRSYGSAFAALAEGAAEADRAPWDADDSLERCTLPADVDGGANTYGAQRELRRDATELLASAEAGGRHRLFECFGGGLAATLGDKVGDTRVLLGLRLHRRHDRPGRSHWETVGCLAGDVPLRVDLSAPGSPAGAFMAAFSAVSMKGSLYEALRHADAVPAVHQVADVRFNFQMVDESAFAGLPVSWEDSWEVRDPEQEREYLLDLIVRARPDRITVCARYSEHRHRAETVEAFLDAWLAATAELLNG